MESFLGGSAPEHRSRLEGFPTVLVQVGGTTPLIPETQSQPSGSQRGKHVIQAQPIRRCLPGASEERGCKEAGSLEALACAGGRIRRPGQRRGCRRSGSESRGSRRHCLIPPLRGTRSGILHYRALPHVARSPGVSSRESPRPPSGSVVHQRDSKNPATLSYPQSLFITAKAPHRLQSATGIGQREGPAEAHV